MEMCFLLIFLLLAVVEKTKSKFFNESKNEHEQKRVVCDFIAGMTDQYANRFYERLFLPRHGSVFDRL